MALFSFLKDTLKIRRRVPRRRTWDPQPCERLEARTLLAAVIGDAAAESTESTWLVLLETPESGQQATQHADFLAELNTLFANPVDVLFDYSTALNGMAIALTADQAERVSQLPDVETILADEYSQLQSNSAESVGAVGVWDGSGTGGAGGSYGEGVLIGIIDSGIDPSHESFAEVGPVDGYVHVNPFGDGVYVGVGDPTSSHYDATLSFNNKLVGAWNYTSDAINDATDGDHGTSVAGIAAGNFVTVPVPDSTETTEVSGVAPHANIISYDVCTTTGECSNSAILEAVDQAIIDGVDVINVSIAGPSSDPWDAVMARAMLEAFEAGIFVSVAVGNDGAAAATIGSPADSPWVTSVAAVGIDDYATSSVSVTGAGVPDQLVDIRATAGENITIPTDVGPARILHAADVSPGDPLGSSAYPAGSFDGAIALIDRGESLFETKVGHAFDAGAIAVIVINNIEGPNITMAGVDGVPIPSVLISQADGTALRQWLLENPDALVQLNAQTTQTMTVTADFSSRGENPQVDTLAPAVAAPGTGGIIIAPVESETHDSWEYFSGSSAAAPHVAGAAALLVALHPDWTPSEIQSALQTTAVSSSEIASDLSLAPADPFDVGSGLVDVAAAARAGFVLDETPGDFAAADPGLGGNPAALNLASFVDSDVNGTTSWTRSITSTQSATVNWTPSFVTDDGLTLSLNSNAVTLTAGATTSLTLTAAISSMSGEWLFGELLLTPDTDLPVARFPVAVRAEPMDGVLIVPSGSGMDVSEFGATDTYEIRFRTAPSQPSTILISAPADVEVSTDGTNFAASQSVTVHNTTPVTITVRAVDDSLSEGIEDVVITHAITAPTSGSNYNAQTTIDSITVSVFDNEFVGVRTPPELISPTGPVTTSRPTFEWTAASGAQSYEIWVSVAGDSANAVINDMMTTTSYTPSVDLGVGRYQYWVRAQYATDDYSAWVGGSFQVNLTAQIQAVPYYAETTTPTFTWDKVAGAANYEIYVANVTTQESPLIQDAGLTSNSYTVTSDLGFGLYRIWVRAIAADGFISSWSAAAEYYVGSELLSPLAPTLSSQPEFQWTEPVGAATYQLYLRAPGGSVTNLTGLTSASYTPSAELPNGQYYWWVRPFTADGRAGQWSQRGATWVGGRPTVLTPDPDSTGQAPELTWTAVDGAISYEVYLDRTDEPQHILRVTDLASPEFAPPILDVGSYAVWVRAKAADGSYGVWSARYDFSATSQVGSSATATPDQQLTVTFDTTPELTWQASGEAVSYHVYLHDGQTGSLHFGFTTTTWQAPELGQASWRWWVRAVDSTGAVGPWSSPATIDTTGRAIGLSPTGTTTSLPTIEWTEVVGAERYILQVDNLTTAATILREDNLNTTSYVPLAPLASGTYRFWVRALNSADVSSGPWSVAIDFVVV